MALKFMVQLTFKLVLLRKVLFRKMQLFCRLLLLFYLCRAQTPTCPRKCHCDLAGRVQCYRVGEVPKEIAKTTRGIYISHGKIKHLQITDISSMSALEEFVLTWSGTESVENNTFKALDALRTLELRKNKLRLPHTLARLDLKGNSIQRIKEQELKNLRHLQVLNLRNNNISTIDHSLWKYLPRLRYLYLDSNPWNCTCEFLKTRRVLTAKGIDVKGGKCKAPSESQGESWMSSKKVLHLCAHNNLYSLEEGDEIGKNTSVDNPSSLRVNMDDYYDYEIY
ncbi:nephrocan-like [Podarcis lilfordi]|uniref:Nephrocan-like n=1 Tax=Podarcis lilfordi TaxID=74358 RepID=A0AA35K2M1_9SAUR|nr:nephrocan-like [Podarcis lilfordi]